MIEKADGQGVACLCSANGRERCEPAGKKRKAGAVHFADKMPSKNDDDNSDDENELNQFESLSINGADDNEESSSDGSNN